MSDALCIAMVAACPFPCERGTPVRIRRLADALARRGHRVHVVTYHLGDAEPAGELRIHRTPRVPTYRRMEAGPSWQKLLVMDPLLAWTLRRVLREHPVDVVHAHHVEGLLAARAARGRSRAPIVFDVHTLLESELPSYRLGIGARLARRIGRALDLRLPRGAAHTVAVSEAIRDRLLQTGSASEASVSVIPSGVERELLAANAAQRAGARRPGDPPRLLFAGGFERYQRIDLLLEAFAGILAARPDARLELASTFPFDEWEPLARRLGVLGAIDVVRAGFGELPQRLARADVALNPRTDCDGLPQKLLNYMAAALPVVSFRSAAPGLRDGDTALLVEDGDVQAFAAAALRVLGDPALGERLGASAQAFVSRARSWEHAAEQTERVYRRVLGR